MPSARFMISPLRARIASVRLATSLTALPVRGYALAKVAADMHELGRRRPEGVRVPGQYVGELSGDLAARQRAHRQLLANGGAGQCEALHPCDERLGGSLLRQVR